MDESIYAAAGGREAVVRLAGAWHEQCLADPVVSHPFAHGTHPEHVRRLAAYWIEQLGGPPEYTGGGLGDHSSVVRRHAGNGEHADMDRRAIACFVRALDDAGLAGDARLAATLTAWFTAMVEEMAAFPDSADDVPPELPLPRWEWSGRA